MGFPMAITPGDGAMAFFPLFLPPTKLKEYMFLSRAWTAKELAEMNIVNYAVPAAELDAVFNDIMARLSARPASVLGAHQAGVQQARDPPGEPGPGPLGRLRDPRPVAARSRRDHVIREEPISTAP